MGESGRSRSVYRRHVACHSALGTDDRRLPFIHGPASPLSTAAPTPDVVHSRKSGPLCSEPRAGLRGALEPRPSPPPPVTQDVDRPLRGVSPPTALVIRSRFLVFGWLPFFFIMAPKHRGGDASSSDVTKGSRYVLPLSEKVLPGERDILRERDHVHVPFIIVYCGPRSISLLTVVTGASFVN